MATREMLVQRLLQAFDYPNRETRTAADLVSLRRQNQRIFDSI